MIDQFTKPNHTDSYDWHAAVIQDFSIYLRKRGHSEGTQNAYQSALKHFLYWFAKELPAEQTISTETVYMFCRHHLSVCRCPCVNRGYKTTRAALNHLLKICGNDESRCSVYGVPSAFKRTLHEFDYFQRDVCGLAESTRLYRQRFVRTFLCWLFGSSKIDYAKITSENLLRFVTAQAASLKPSSINVLSSALRSYLRFLQFKGKSNVTLLASLPKPPNWSLATIPPSLSDIEIEAFFSTFDVSTSIGKRDYAMARLLADLGLRCHEVAPLKIDDINWYQGVINLHHNKNRRQDQLPLPDKTGRAIVDYLRKGRPKTTSRSIFVFHRAPLGRGVENTTVRGAIRRAFTRAGLPYTGTHILRHTAATKMVQNGTSLKEVADVLRHRDMNTTSIYTKVNLPELKQVAMPWPEEY